jgi:hypothetical protein
MLWRGKSFRRGKITLQEGGPAFAQKLRHGKHQTGFRVFRVFRGSIFILSVLPLSSFSLQPSAFVLRFSPVFSS